MAWKRGIRSPFPRLSLLVLNSQDPPIRLNNGFGALKGPLGPGSTTPGWGRRAGKLELGESWRSVGGCQGRPLFLPLLDPGVSRSLHGQGCISPASPEWAAGICWVGRGLTGWEWAASAVGFWNLRDNRRLTPTPLLCLTSGKVGGSRSWGRRGLGGAPPRSNTTPRLTHDSPARADGGTLLLSLWQQQNHCI